MSNEERKPRELRDWNERQLIGFMYHKLNRLGDMIEELDDQVWDCEIALKRIAERVAPEA
jgi:hypothetical protein